MGKWNQYLLRDAPEIIHILKVKIYILFYWRWNYLDKLTMEKRAGDFWWKWGARCYYAHVVLSLLLQMVIGEFPVSIQFEVKRWCLQHCLNLYKLLDSACIICTEDDFPWFRPSLARVSWWDKNLFHLYEWISASLKSVILHLFCSFVFVLSRLNNSCWKLWLWLGKENSVI